jgi:hypothetical protein
MSRKELRERLSWYFDNVDESDIPLFFPKAGYGGGAHWNILHLFGRGCEFLIAGDLRKSEVYFNRVRAYIDMGLELDDPAGYSRSLQEWSPERGRPIMRFELLRARFFLEFVQKGNRENEHLVSALEHVQAWLDQYAYAGDTRLRRFVLVHWMARIMLARLLVGQVSEAKHDFESVLRPLPAWPRRPFKLPEREEAVMSMILAFLCSGTDEQRSAFVRGFDHFLRVLRQSRSAWRREETLLSYTVTSHLDAIDYGLLHAQLVTGEYGVERVLRSVLPADHGDRERTDAVGGTTADPASAESPAAASASGQPG